MFSVLASRGTREELERSIYFACSVFFRWLDPAQPGGGWALFRQTSLTDPSRSSPGIGLDLPGFRRQRLKTIRRAPRCASFGPLWQCLRHCDVGLRVSCGMRILPVGRSSSKSPSSSRQKVKAAARMAAARPEHGERHDTSERNHGGLTRDHRTDHAVRCMQAPRYAAPWLPGLRSERAVSGCPRARRRLSGPVA